MKKTIISFVLFVCTLFSCMIAFPAAAEGSDDFTEEREFEITFYPYVAEEARAAAMEKLKDDYNKKYNAEMTYTLTLMEDKYTRPGNTITYWWVADNFKSSHIDVLMEAARSLAGVWSVTDRGPRIERHLYGDVNENEVIDLADLIVIKRMVMQSGDTSFVSHTGRVYSDIDGNGKIDSVDYLLVKRMYLGTLALKWVE